MAAGTDPGKLLETHHEEASELAQCLGNCSKAMTSGETNSLEWKSFQWEIAYTMKQPVQFP